MVVKCIVVFENVGANIDTPRMHTTAVHLSALNRSIDFVSLLLHFGANVYARNNEGKLASDLVPKTSDVYRMLKYAECECLYTFSNFKQHSLVK